MPGSEPDAAAPPPPPLAPTPRSVKAQLRRYVIAMTAGGLVIGLGSFALPGMVGLGAPALFGAAILTVLLGRSVGPVALLAPLAPAVVWAVVLGTLIAVGTEPGSDDRDLSTLFAFLAIAIVLVGGVVCAGLGAAWGALSPDRPSAPDQTSAR